MLRFAVALSVVPPPAWLVAADAALAGQLGAYPPAELLQALRSVARLRLVPSSALLTAAEEAVAAAVVAEGANKHHHHYKQQQQAAVAAGGPSRASKAPPLPQQLQEALRCLQQAAAAGSYPRQLRKLPLSHRRRLRSGQLRQPTPSQLVPRIAKQQQRWRRLGRIKRLGGQGSTRRHGVGWQRDAATAAAAEAQAEAGGSSAPALSQGPTVLGSSGSNGAHRAVALQEVHVAVAAAGSLQA
jgi:hypothetical protein